MLGNLNGKVREIERSAIRIRKFAGLSPFAKLNPYELAEKLGMQIIDFNSLQNLTTETARTLLINKAADWSGTSSGVLPDGSVIIVLNQTQSSLRQTATLMEEICHVLLGHTRDRLVFDQTRPDFNRRVESEAFGVGAATLVPYVALKEFLPSRTLSEVAEWFGVSKSLVEYRCKFTHL